MKAYCIGKGRRWFLGPGIARERRTFDFVPFCASDRVRTYFRADSRQKLVDDELYADPTRVADK